MRRTPLTTPALVLALTLLTCLAGIAAPVAITPAATAVPVTAIGRVVDAGTGQPVRDAQVEVLGLSGVLLTDADGRYSFPSEPTTISITARLRGYYETATINATISASGTLPDIALVARPTAVLSGTVLADADGSPLAGAEVRIEGPAYEILTTDSSGRFSKRVPLGPTLVTAEAPGLRVRTVSIDLTTATTLAPIRLTVPPPGVEVRVRTSAGGPARGLTVRATPDGASAATAVTDTTGVAFFPLSTPAKVLVEAVSGARMIARAAGPRLDFTGAFVSTDLTVDIDTGCSPSTTSPTGLADPGFESGLASWTQGFVADSAEVITGDSFVPSAPQGARMLRLGRTADSADVVPSPGPAVLCQDFVVTPSTATLQFRVFTYDFGVAEGITLSLVDPVGGSVVATVPGTVTTDAPDRLVDTGWVRADFALGGLVGRTLRLRLVADNDSLSQTWVYVDAVPPPAPPVPPAPTPAPTGPAPAAAPTASSTVLRVPRAARRGKVVRVGVSVSAASPATGAVVVRQGAKVVGRGTVVNGAASIRLAKFKKPGRFKLVATFEGSGAVAGSRSRTVVLRVR